MNFVRFIYDQNWNIGFCNLTPEEFISSKHLAEIRWLKHPYRDRWFADPFILKVTQDEIVVLAEECPIANPKGIICELIVDKMTMKLKERHVLLELDSHLSYPFIVEDKEHIYVYPENGYSGVWKRYEYDGINHCLKDPVTILSESIADASILHEGVSTYVIATKFPQTQENAYLYKMDDRGVYRQIGDVAISKGLISRPGGAWIKYDGKLYRPAQDCSIRYGGALAIKEVELEGNVYKEKIAFTLNPNDKKYRLGLHTINFKDNLCVIDGCSYLYPLCGKVYEILRSIKRKLL